MKPIIFYIKNDVPIQNNTFQFLLQFVQPEKQERILRQRIKQNADNMLIGDILAKTAIKKVFGVEIAKQHIEYGKYGKPYLLDYPNIHFNISHSGKYVVCAVCDVPVGIDIQKITAYNPSTAYRVCSDDELNIIEKSQNKESEFIRIWTRKEAYLKMKGSSIAKIKANISENAYSYRIEIYWLSISFNDTLQIREQIEPCYQGI